MRLNLNRRHDAPYSLAMPMAICLALCAAVLAPIAQAAEVALATEPIADFTLRDYNGRELSLSDFDDSQIVVIAFLGTDCPLVKLYGPRLQKMAREYQERGVAFVGINSNRQDAIRKIGAFAHRHGIEFPILKDPDNQIADRFSAVRTPEVFVLDAQRNIRYRGRIDDQYGVGTQLPEPRRHDLQLAIDELLDGNPVSEPLTYAPGCIIGRIPKVDPHGDVTYSNQIARILQRRCVECHREGEIGPFPLTNYDEVVGWGEMIAEVIDQQRMPPWFANAEHGQFKNNPQLTPDEIQLVRSWVDNGAPEGDPQQLPEPFVFPDGWRIEEPDAVYYMSDEEFTVQADGVVDYQYFTVDPGFKEDKWVKAADARPGNRSVVHHIIVFFQPPGQNSQFGASRGGVAGYAPGMPPSRLPEGVAMKVPAGSKFVFQMHYTPVGTEQTDRSYVGLVFADPSEVKQEAKRGLVGNLSFRIPPNDPAYEVKARTRVSRDTLLMSLTPHMHYRGKSFRFEVEYPDGIREVLLDVPRYDFNWQLRYDLIEPKLIPRGSRLYGYAVFDNSEDNPYNPDPTAEVTFGEQSWEEMMFGFYTSVDPAEDRQQAAGDGD